ncbi:hypothetical protein SAMN05216228_1008116 [Rhizobium tibeticum]|uniref:Uncharacterized protein n=1 Tax=Rhizobium tibeticum TaxID=501024 RepID=A0A1H8JZ23_9HYPH|nr:hypothetical protein [Rhizobium tibeticum]SEH78530.1 hypothetical protein RTCCBAU85039_2342 [Rhizobium tibeticum]SEN85962.1 hypothetical protein SAMN05216228_1008116 [Rhizobium tibeticum]
MSMNLNYPANLMPPVWQRLTDTSTVRIGEVADDTLILSGFSITNDGSAAKVVSLIWYDGANEKVIWKKSVAQDDTAFGSDFPIRLRKNNEIRAKGAADICVTLFYSFLVPNSGVNGLGGIR